jgi:hypothetical protein
MGFLQNYCRQTDSNSFSNYHGKYHNYGIGKCGESAYSSSYLLEDGVCNTEQGSPHAYEFYSPSNNL